MYIIAIYTVVTIVIETKFPVPLPLQSTMASIWGEYPYGLTGAKVEVELKILHGRYCMYMYWPYHIAYCMYSGTSLIRTFLL